MNERFVDILIVGAGPAGLAAAISAREKIMPSHIAAVSFSWKNIRMIRATRIGYTYKMVEPIPASSTQ